MGLPLDQYGERMPDDHVVNSFLLDLTGIIFAVQFVALLIIGAYADYGKWRPWVLVGESLPFPIAT